VIPPLGSLFPIAQRHRYLDLEALLHKYRVQQTIYVDTYYIRRLAVQSILETHQYGRECQIDLEPRKHAGDRVVEEADS
jgi:hypothetical protein